MKKQSRNRKDNNVGFPVKTGEHKGVFVIPIMDAQVENNGSNL